MKIPNSIRNINRRILNGVALGYKLSDIPSFIIVKSGLQYSLRKEVARRSLGDRTINLKAHIVSLRFRCDRRIQIIAGLKMAQVPYHLHDAVYGRSITINQISTAQFSEQSRKYLSSGSIGAIISHYQVWISLLNSGEKTHLILEDDVIIEPELLTRIKNLHLPFLDFDIVYLGSGTKKKFNFRTSVDEQIFEPFYPRKGLYAYIITNNGIRNIIKHLFPIKITCGSLDTIVGNLVRKKIIKALQVFPDMCFVDLRSPSNIYNFSDRGKKLHEMELV
jgi:GR25 family glycosyltransferase involved in LPS biosynthesis